MTIKCALCDEKEFPVIFESHHTIKEQPVIICYGCFKSACYFLEEYCGEEADSRIKGHKKFRKSFKPKRCEKEAN